MAGPNVNKPTNIAAKDADINRKLQAYGIASAFKNGKAPSNDQVDVALNSFLSTKALSSPSDRLSEDGKVLVSDVKDVVEKAKDLVLSKNDGNLLQQFIYETQHFDKKAVTGPGKPVDKDTVKNQGKDALQSLKTLGTLILTNGQFRKLLKDATVLLRDMAGDAAAKAAKKVKPSEEKLAEVDKPAADNTWADPSKVSKEAMKAKMSKVYQKKPEEETDAEPASEAAAKDAKKPKQKLSDKIPTETKEKAKARAQEYKSRSREYFNQKMPTERRDQIIFRLKKIVLECQSRPDYQEALETLLNLAEQYTGHAKSTGKGGAQTAKQTRTTLQQAEAQLRTLIERCANGTSMGGFFEAIDAIYKAADKDPELKGWFKSVTQYIRRCLQEQGYVMDKSSTKDGHKLHDQGRVLLREKYRSHTNRIADEARFLGEQFNEDPLNKSFAHSVQKLFKDLGKDADGKVAFKPHLLKDLSQVVVPAIFENVAYIPVPRIEHSDPKMDVIVENLVLESDNFTPNTLEIKSDHAFRWGRKQGNNFNKKDNKVEVAVKGIQMDLRDVAYHVKKKQGFPSVTDTGVCDILLPGDGLSFKMKMSTPDAADKQHFFKVDKVDVDIGKLKIKLKKSKFKFLFGLAQPILMKVLRPAIRKAAEKVIKDQFNEMDSFLYEIKVEADKGKGMESADESGKKPGMYARYADALKNKMLESKQKKEEAKKQKSDDSKNNVAMTQEDSIFPDIHLPGGISSKATEYKELARKGDKWESPVFSIGSAPKSSKVLPPPEIRRKKAPQKTGVATKTTGDQDAEQESGDSGFKDGINGAIQYMKGSTFFGSGNGETAQSNAGRA